MNGFARTWASLLLALAAGVAVDALIAADREAESAQWDEAVKRQAARRQAAHGSLWTCAEERGVAELLLFVIGSDFGRANIYDADDGNDHWLIGSSLIMENSQPWKNRAVGETDRLHFAQRANLRPLECDDPNGTVIYPKHAHKDLRSYLGIGSTPGARRFPFSYTEDFVFFG